MDEEPGRHVSQLGPDTSPGLTGHVQPEAAVLEEHSGSSAGQFTSPCAASQPGALLIARLVTLYPVCVSIIRSRALFHAP